MASSDFSGVPPPRGRERFEGPIGPGWRVITWALIVWTLALAGWLTAAAVAASRSRALDECLADAATNPFLPADLCRDAAALGVGLDVAAIAAVWFAGFVILSLIWLMTKLNRMNN